MQKKGKLSPLEILNVSSHRDSMVEGNSMEVTT